MQHPHSPILLRPIHTEKATRINETLNQVTFAVRLDATKDAIKRAVVAAYRVTVRQVRTVVLPGKVRRRGNKVSKTSSWKKALVRLGPDETIDFQATE